MMRQDKARSLEQRSWKQLQRPGCGEGVWESRRWQWPLQGYAGRAAPSLKCKLLTHSHSKSRSSGGTAGRPAIENHLIGKIPIGAGFTAFRLLVRYLGACGRKSGPLVF